MSTTNIITAPVFDRDSYNVTIPSVVGVGLILTTLTARNADASDTLVYSIIDGNDDGLFGIDAVTGAITVADVGVRSEFTRYTLTVQVTDSSGRIDTAELVLANQTLPGRGNDKGRSLHADYGEIGEIGYAYGGNDSVFASASFGGIMYGGSGNDTMYSQNPVYVFYGGSGLDRLTVADDFVNNVFYGGRDIDYLLGGSGADFLDGGDGSDVLEGRGGADIFVLDTNDSGSDVIRFFNPGEGDKIRIEVTDPTISTLEELLAHAGLRVAVEHVDTLSFESFQPEALAQIIHVKFPYTNNATILDTAIYKVVGEVDRISGGDDEIVVVLKDFDAPLTYSMFDVVLSILDSEAYSGAVSEDAAIDSAILKITANNPSTTLSYSIISGNDAGLFAIDDTGQIALANTLDYETAPHHIIAVQVTDSAGRTDMAEVVINVLNVNEHAPIFGADTYDAEIIETAAKGAAVLQVVAADADRNERLDYAIISGDEAGLFAIDDTGQITLADTLDYETATSHTLTVQATDSGGRTDTAEVIITVANANDESPMFGAAIYNAIIAENAVRGTVLVQIDAADADANDTLNYAITSGNDDGLFSINADSRQITLIGALDYETATSYTLGVQVTDGAGNTDTAEVIVTVADVHENAPIFGMDIYETEIAESAARGTVLVQIAASDADIGDTLNYAITSGNDDGLFSINTDSGQITLIGALDYETATSHTLGVQVTDSVGRTDTAEVVVTVNNVNEYAPIFDAPVYNWVISEDVPPGTVLVRVGATDADIGDVLRYSITSGNDAGLFSIHADSGDITTDGRLDYETTTSHTLGIQVTDSVGQTGTAKVAVSVLNVNEFTPVFGMDIYEAEIVDDAVRGTLIVRVDASDADADETLNYSITGGNDAGLFSINADNGDITLIGALDYETATSHTLTVQVTDSIAHADIAQVVINVLNSNAFAPVFGMDTYEAEIAENAARGTHLVRVGATDGDEGDTLSYAITSGNDDGLFNINADSGQITLVSALDYETATSHTLGVLVTDSGGKTDTAEIVISVLNVNEHAPIFGKDIYETAIVENATTDTAILRVAATDADVGDTLNYAITSGNDARLFSINADSGQITLFGALDYETATSHTLGVQVTDSEGRTDTAAVVISVLNVNEHAPIFGTIITNQLVAETVPTGTILMHVTATDADAGDTLRYSITSGNDGGLFSINVDSGQITLVSALDYETATSHTLGVQVTDSGGRTDTAEIVISVLNVNEHAPIFGKDIYETAIVETAAQDTAILRVAATDADADTTLRYAITSGNDDGLFSINVDSGQITLVGALDYETATSHTLIVQVTDNANRTNAAEVVINVLNVNEHAPIFSDATYHAEVAEDAMRGTAVAQIVASDADIGDVLRYAITSGNDDGLFNINTDSGQITLVGALDYETATSHTLTIQVTDSTGQTGTANLIVAVADVDEGNLFFDEEIYLFPNIPETATTGYAIGSVSATDIDGDALIYSIFAGNDAGLFAVDATSGVMTIATPNQVTNSATISMTLQVEDSAGHFDKVTVAVYDPAIRGTDNGDVITGVSTRDIIYGGAGADTLNGKGNADSLYGGAGDDTLNGGDGADILSGGTGRDFLQGRRGNDVFVLNTAGGENDGDVVIDFRGRGNDTLRIDVTDPAAITNLAELETSANLRIDKGRISLPDFPSNSDHPSRVNTVIYHNNGTATDRGDDILLMVLEDFTGLNLNMIELI